MYNFKIKGGEHENDLNHREQLIRDMIYICCLPNFSQKNRREFIDVCVSWSFSDRTENDINQSAKYKGCKYWSEDALKRIDNKGNWIDDKKDKGLRHEHIVPRSIFINAVDNHFKEIRKEIWDNNGDIEEIANREFLILMEKMKVMQGCVVTSEEADRIDGKTPGKKGNGIYKNDMPESAYKSGKPKKESWELFSEITDQWARYKTETSNDIHIYELEWFFNTKSKKWETDKTTKKPAF